MFPLAAITSDRTLAVVMAAGLVVIFFLLATLVWTRWGQARPISKCVVLSLLAHILLLIYAWSTHVLYGPPGRWYGQTVTVRLHDAADDVEAAPHLAADPEPWEQSGQVDEPLREAAPIEAVEKLSNEAAAAAVDAPPLLSADHQDETSEAETGTVNSIQPESASAAVAREGSTAESVPAPAEMPQLTDLLPSEEPSAESSSGAAKSVANAKDQQPSTESESASASPVNEQGGQLVTSAGPPRRLGDGHDVPEPLQARVAADRLKAAVPFGATPRSEAAVAAALDWLAGAQSQDGRWDADAFGAGRETRTLGHDRGGAGGRADTGVSGLALLAFLGAGETHLEGEHRENVQRGLEFVLASQAVDGSLSGNAEFFAKMYCHGIAALALSEAYALSGDERLLPGLRRALTYTIQAQHAGGGWRYQPFDEGDMSQFGWQLMALKSAELGGIPMPAQTRARMVRFLQSCTSGRSRGLAAYRPGDRVSRTMTAEALVCRYFLASEHDERALAEAAGFIGEERPGSGPTNFYYWYYGTLALFQRQGEEWARWNAALQQQLLSRQRWDGAHAGSWDPDDVWGGYGGRIYSTSLGALCLEVYYRYLPLHGRDTGDSRLTDRPWVPGVAR
jgi:hypothetical protein